MTERPAAQYVALDLPAPISVNELWRPRKNAPGFAKTDAYAKWLAAAGLMINAQRPGSIPGPYAMTLKVKRTWRGDLGNAEKAVSDLLQSCGVIKNDRYAQRIVAERADVDGMHVMIVATKEAAPETKDD